VAGAAGGQRRHRLGRHVQRPHPGRGAARQRRGLRRRRAHRQPRPLPGGVPGAPARHRRAQPADDALRQRAGAGAGRADPAGDGEGGGGGLSAARQPDPEPRALRRAVPGQRHPGAGRGLGRRQAVERAGPVPRRANPGRQQPAQGRRPGRQRAGPRRRLRRVRAGAADERAGPGRHRPGRPGQPGRVHPPARRRAAGAGGGAEAGAARRLALPQPRRQPPGDPLHHHPRRALPRRGGAGHHPARRGGGGADRAPVQPAPARRGGSAQVPGRAPRLHPPRAGAAAGAAGPRRRRHRRRARRAGAGGARLVRRAAARHHAAAALVVAAAGGAGPVPADAGRLRPAAGAGRRRGAAGELRSRLGLVAGLLAVAVLVGVQSGEPQLAGWVILGAGATAGVLALLAWGLVRLLSPLRRRSGVAWRFGLGNIAPRRGSAVAQAVALGIALLALLLITVVRTDLLSSWRDRLPPDAPNQFLVNIQPEQVPALRRFFAERGFPPLDMAPMVRGRLVALNGKPVTADSFQDQETRRWINREFNLSWTDHFGADNKLVDGRWWSAADAGKPWLSVDEYGVERLGLMPGTTMTLEIAGVRSTFTVHNTRKVRWDSFRPNFFIVTPPGVLENSGAVQWITSFYLPPQQRPLLRELVRQFPNVTALDLDAMLGQVRGIVDRIVAALEFIFAFTLGAGLVVMLAVIEASRAQRARETALLRTLGASSRVILQGLLAEYAVLGLLAGGVAAIAAQAMAWV